MYENGEDGVKVNWSEARKYYKLASFQGKILSLFLPQFISLGNENSSFRIGIMYYEGMIKSKVSSTCSPYFSFHCLIFRMLINQLNTSKLHPR